MSNLLFFFLFLRKQNKKKKRNNDFKISSADFITRHAKCKFVSIKCQPAKKLGTALTQYFQHLQNPILVWRNSMISFVGKYDF